MDLGLQMWSVHDVCVNEGFEAVMKQIKPMGYNGFEFAINNGATLSDRVGYPVDPKELKHIMDYYGVKPIGSHIDLGALLREPETVLRECLALELPYVATGPSFEADRLPKPDQIERNSRIAKAAKLLQENGIKLQVHCAAYGWMRDYLGRWTSEGMIEDAGGPKFLELELDLAWLICAGLDPVEMMQKHKGNLNIVHFKDFHPLPDWSEYVLVRHNTICNHGYGCAVGDAGVLDVKQLVETAQECNVQWIVTELWNEPNSLENARISAKNIRKYL